jgi:hypothetical protein
LRHALRDASRAAGGSTRGVFVLGMHRSGTSALTGMLAGYGLDLGPVASSSVADPAAANPRGNQEDREVRDVNEGLLDANGGSWHEPPRVRRIPWLLRTRVRQLERRLSRAPRRWGIKDPRTLLCDVLWQGIDADRVGTFRHPANVVASLVRRHPGRHTLVEWEALWRTYNERLLERYRERTFPIVDFDWPAQRYCAAVERVARSLGLAADGEDFFDETFRRNTDLVEIRNPETRKLYARLVASAETEEQKLCASFK